jgi:hypothetical protein
MKDSTSAFRTLFTKCCQKKKGYFRWSVESSVWSPNPITPVFQYSLTPTFGFGYAGLGSSPHFLRVVIWSLASVSFQFEQLNETEAKTPYLW